MYSLGQITQINPKLGNINDVQLDWYPNNPHNLQLTEGYQWSDHALGNAKPSIEILNRIREAFLMSASPRRFLVRATFGHGKTHLALALANYFGGAADSVEVQNILEQIRHTSEPKAQSFATFKTGRAPFLVVRLAGEKIDNLAQAVVRALEKALSEHEASRDYELGFWFKGALEGLAKLNEEQIGRANAFLQSYHSDLPTLIRGLEERDGELFQMTCSLVEHLTGFAPDFGQRVELKALIEQVANDLCGEGKPFSGVLVLFDEFSAFMRYYARDYLLHSGTPLQSLLDGIVNCGARAAFVGFSQYDLDADVGAIFAQIGAGQDARANIDKELNRLPMPERFLLQSSLELVLSNFLRQDQAAFDELTKDDDVWDQVIEATDTVMRLYGDHYSTEQGWGDDRVQTVITQGCFPFHPLTIALLCKANLRGDESGARTLQQYITGTFRDYENTSALIDDRLNWIAPISLVEGFGKAIVENDTLWNQYQQALLNVGGEATEVQKAVLNAMLLHYVANLKVSRNADSYERNIADLSGLEIEEVQSVLRALFGAGYIKRDDTRGVYAFWPLGEDGTKVETPLHQEATTIQANPEKLTAVLRQAISKNGREYQEIAGAPGHPQDWAAEQWILPRALFSAEQLRKLVKQQSIVSAQLQDAPRAYVFSLLATTNEDLSYFRTNAQAILDEAFPGVTPTTPVVLRLPKFVQGNFVNMLVREQVLLGWDAEKKQSVGAKPYEDALASTSREIQQNLFDFVTDSYVVSASCRTAVAARTTSSTLMQLVTVLKICIEQAYHDAPPFFNQYKSTTTNLKKAVRTACEFFLKGTFAGWAEDSGVQNAGVTVQLYDKFLGYQGAGGWGIVDSSHRISEPTSGKVHKGWELLETSVPRGTEALAIKTVILQLLNAPYGYDVNTVSLLLCAWVGFHQKELEFCTSFGMTAGAVVSLRDCLNNDPRKFIEEVMCNRGLLISRRDPGENKKQVEQLVDKVRTKQPFTREEARTAIIQLEDFANDSTNEIRTIEAARGAASQLEQDLKLAEEYPAKLSALEKKIDAINSSAGAVWLLNETKKPIAIGCVAPPRLISTEDLTKRAYAKATQFNDFFCNKLASLSDIRDTSKNRQLLEQAQKNFADAGLTELRDRVVQALVELGERQASLQVEANDAPFLIQLKGYRTVKDLEVLRDALAEIEKHNSPSEKTAAAKDEARTDIQAKIDAHLVWFGLLPSKLAVAISIREFRALASEINKNLDRFDKAREKWHLEQMLRKLEALEKAWEKLIEHSREKPKNNDDLKRLTKAFDKLLETKDLSDEQKKHIESVRGEVNNRFVTAVEAAEAELTKYETRQQEGEDPVTLKTQIERAVNKELAYLADEHKPRIRALHKALQRRIDDDEIKRVEANFLLIQDPAKRRQCLKLLEKHIAGSGVETILASTPSELDLGPESREANWLANGDNGAREEKNSTTTFEELY